MTEQHEPAVGQVWEDRDRQYAPGRRVRITAASELGTRFTGITVAYPTRPGRIGAEVAISRQTLRAKWRYVEVQS